MYIVSKYCTPKPIRTGLKWQSWCSLHHSQGLVHRTDKQHNYGLMLLLFSLGNKRFNRMLDMRSNAKTNSESMWRQTLHVCVDNDTQRIQYFNRPKWCCALWPNINSSLLFDQTLFQMAWHCPYVNLSRPK